jgi:predicted nucleic acid-binding protein
MIHGMDTGFLVAAEVAEHAEHRNARQTLSRLVNAGDRIAIAPQVLAEFIHVVTDPRRFSQPLEGEVALGIAEQWWTASEVDQVFPNAATVQRFLAWLRQFSLGRKRLLDTMLAATYFEAGVRSILTVNAADFGVFAEFDCITPRAGPIRQT